uniref:Uncharacterized protein n=1 Tax=Oryza glumipatula TaxID=40148 RepID=A0A0D9ZMH7_9ORYZ
MVEKLYAESAQEQGKLLCIESLLQDLHTHFRMVHRKISGINDSALLMISANNEQYHQLLQRLWSLTLDIDDMLNKVSCYLTKTRVLSIQVHSSFILRRLPFRRRIVHKIKQSIVELQECYAQTYRIRFPAKHRDISTPMVCQGAHSIRPEEILGREKEVDDVLTMMQADHGKAGLSVLPITGMAGIGKTTLAQLVFSHPWAVKTFGDDRIWVVVSSSFDDMIILSRLAEFLNTRQCNTVDSESLQCLVKQRLCGRKFLIVLDDVWGQNLQKWKLLIEVLESAKSGSKMIVTSRVPDVVTMTNSLRPYTLKRLLPIDSSNLLTQWMQNSAELPPRLIPIRKMIADTCCGVPSLLLSASNKLKSIRKTEVAWQHVLSRFDLVFYADPLLLDATYVSYQQLPSNIQQCFLYCSLFPVHSFTPEQLTGMFVADDLIKLSSSKSDMHMYFSKIMTEHYYDVMQKPRHKAYAIYKMHPGMQLLAQMISRGFHLAIDARKELVWPVENAKKSARCLSLLVDSKTTELPTELFEMGNLRTLILLRDEKMLLSDKKCSITDIPEEFCKCLIDMRVLHMQSCRIKRVPKLIGMLKKLAYLNLSHNDIEIIPDSICNLQFLKNFNLSRTEIAELPESVGKMQALQVLDLSHCEKLLHLHESKPRDIAKVHCSGKSRAHHLRVASLSLKELGICNMENASFDDARNVILQKKNRLVSLALSWTGSCTDPMVSSKAQQILELLKPNRGLKVLCIFSCPAKKLPSWITSMPPYLKSLTEIKLVNLACECLPPLGQLPLLKIVELSGINAVTRVGDEFYGDDGTFASLEKLSFFHMRNLEIWLPSQREAIFPNLQELTITQCPKFRAVHVKLPVVKSLIMLLNNDKLIGSRGALEGFSQNLKSLSVSLCDGLLECSECEGLRELRGIEELHISRCTELISLPHGMQHLSFLRTLTITECTNLETFPEWLKNFTSLRSLHISNCPKLHIPKSLNNLSNLEISLE